MNEDKFVKWTGLNTIVQSITTTVACGSLLGKLNLLGNYSLMLYNYLGRDAIGQLGGAFYTFNYGKNIINDVNNTGIKSNNMLNLSVVAESGIAFSKINGNRMLFSLCLANVGKNIGWIGTGAVNSYYMVSLTDNVPHMYSQLSIINSVACTIGTGIGFCLLKINTKIRMISNLLLIGFQSLSYYCLLNELKVIRSLKYS